MRRSSFFSVFFVLILCLAVLGYMRGWFTVSSRPDQTSNQVDISLTVDPDKAKQDVDDAAETVAKTVRQGAETLNNKARETSTPDPK